MIPHIQLKPFLIITETVFYVTVYATKNLSKLFISTLLALNQ